MSVQDELRIMAMLESTVRIRGRHVRRNFKGAMVMTELIQGVKRGSTAEQDFQTDPLGHNDLAIAQALAPYAVMAGSRQIFAGNTFAGTAKAPVGAPPTTSPEWMLFNGSTTKAKTRVFLSEIQKSCPVGEVENKST